MILAIPASLILRRAGRLARLTSAPRSGAADRITLDAGFVIATPTEFAWVTGSRGFRSRHRSRRLLRLRGLPPRLLAAVIALMPLARLKPVGRVAAVDVWFGQGRNRLGQKHDSQGCHRKLHRHHLRSTAKTVLSPCVYLSPRGLNGA